MSELDLDSAGFVASESDDGAAVAVRPVRPDVVVLLVSDDEISCRGLSASTHAAVEQQGGMGLVATRSHILGLVHVRWSLASSEPSHGQLGMVREVCSARSYLGYVTHWLDYKVVSAAWLPRPLPEGAPLRPPGWDALSRRISVVGGSLLEW